MRLKIKSKGERVFTTRLCTTTEATTQYHKEQHLNSIRRIKNESR